MICYLLMSAFHELRKKRNKNRVLYVIQQQNTTSLCIDYISYLCTIYFNHSMNGSSDSVNGDLQFLWDRQISTPTKSIPLNRSIKKTQHSWLRPRDDPLYHIWYKYTHWGLLGKWVKYNKKIFFIYLYLFLRLAYRSDRLIDFYVQ